MESDRKTLSAGEVALARATLYRLCAQAFRHPGRDWPAEWNAIARGIGAALEVLALDGCGTAELHDAFDLAWAAARDPGRIRRDHVRLMGHCPRAGTTPYETEWTGSAGELLQYHLLADLGGFYRAFGLELATGCDERPDHLSIELCFLSFLCVKEATAEERALAPLLEAVREGQQKFLDEHLLRWAAAFCARVKREDPGGYYGQAATLLERFLARERERFALPTEGGFQPLGDTSLSLEDCCVGCEYAKGCAGPASPATETG